MIEDRPTTAVPPEPAAPEPATPEPTAPESMTPAAAPIAPRSGAGRWFMRLIVVFLFAQLVLWLAVGRRTLIRKAPEMILSDVHSIVSIGESLHEQPIEVPRRVYVISDRLAQAIGDDRLYGLERSLGRYNGTVLAEDNRTFIEHAAVEGCGDCLFVGLRQTLNTPFFARSYTSYTRSMAVSDLGGVETATREREHVYVYFLGRWIPVRTAWIEG